MGQWRYWIDKYKPIIAPDEWRTVCCGAPVYQATTTDGIYSITRAVIWDGKYHALYCMACDLELERGELWEPAVHEIYYMLGPDQYTMLLEIMKP